MIEGKKILVTGGAGYIGSHLVDALVEKNSVTVLDDLSTGTVENIRQHFRKKNFKFIKGTVEDGAIVKHCARGCNLIIHEAAVVGVKWYVTDPLRVLRVNSIGTENVLEAAMRNEAKVVFASTSEVYGKSGKLPLREDGERLLGSTTIDRWCYSTSKAFDEHMCFAYRKKYGLPVVVLRYFNSYGPRADSSDYSGVVPIFIRRVLAGKPPLVHGDGQQTRCFTFISDTVAGTLAACEEKKAVGEVINIGSDRETRIIDLARTVVSLCGKKLEPELIPYEKFYGKSYEDIRRRVPDARKAREILGWEPRVSLEEGLARTINWYKKGKR